MADFKVTHKQHFVWRSYLKPWCEIKTNKKSKEIDYIWWNNRKVIRQTDVFDILREKDFYEYKYLNNLELFLRKNFFVTSGWKELEKTTEFYDNISYFANQLANEKYQGQFRDFLINLGELLQRTGEKIGERYIPKLYSDDISFFNANEEDGMDFLFYLVMQYFRTKAMRNQSIITARPDYENFKQIYKMESNDDTEYSIDWNNIYNYGYIYLVNNATYGLIHYNSHIKLLKSSGLRFIVSDQPIYNCSEDKSKKLVLFYPIDPNRALLISSQFAKNEIVNISDEEVLHYNLLTVENPCEYIMGKEKVDIDFKF